MPPDTTHHSWAEIRTALGVFAKYLAGIAIVTTLLVLFLTKVIGAGYDGTDGPKAEYNTREEQALLLRAASSVGALVACQREGDYNAEVVAQAAYAHLRAVFLPYNDSDGDSEMGVMAVLANAVLDQAVRDRSVLLTSVVDGKITATRMPVRDTLACKAVEAYLKEQLAPGAILGFPLPSKERSL